MGEQRIAVVATEVIILMSNAIFYYNASNGRFFFFESWSDEFDPRSIVATTGAAICYAGHKSESRFC